MSSQPEEHTSLAAHKGEARVVEEGSRTMAPRQGYCSATATVTSNTRNEQCRVSEAPVLRNGYGAVDTVSVCRSCQHLYAGNPEVVLSPASLENHLPRHAHSYPKPVSVYRPWTARKYEGLCECEASVSGGVCVCQERGTHGALHNQSPCSDPCLKKMKLVALVMAGLLPWVFLVAYIVLTNI